jgi:catechol 2,3-dioxygenase-like lactoylglutathione lyase family enzyme
MAKLRHLAIATNDPDATAEFYKQAFDFKEVGRVDADLASGIYLSDGTINTVVVRAGDGASSSVTRLRPARAVRLRSAR